MAISMVLTAPEVARNGSGHGALGAAGRACQDPLWQVCQCRQDHTRQTADSCQPKLTVGNEMSVFSDSNSYCPIYPEHTSVRFLSLTLSKPLSCQQAASHLHATKPCVKSQASNYIFWSRHSLGDLGSLTKD